MRMVSFCGVIVLARVVAALSLDCHRVALVTLPHGLPRGKVEGVQT